MASPTEIAPKQLARLIGTPAVPALLDVRLDDDVALDPVLIPTARRITHTDLDTLELDRSRRVVVVCHGGLKLSHGVAARLRARGLAAEVLEGGHLAWRREGHLAVPIAALPGVKSGTASRWVTRQRPKIDRLACPWLIRRFVDPGAEILFVPSREVLAVAERFDAEPFDVSGAPLSHRGDRCTFDAVCERFGLDTPALQTVADTVRAADFGRPEVVPEAAGLLAISLGLSRLHRDDLAQLDAGMVVYDALFRWARDARGEHHDDSDT